MINNQTSLSGRRKIELAPSILSADFSRLGEQVREAESAGADYIHIDVMDGHFVPNITIGPLVVQALRPVTRLSLQVHLMIEQPERYIEDFCRAGSDTIIVHTETCPHLERTLHQIVECGARPGVTLNPATPLVALEEVLQLVDLVLVMTVNPGFGGQKLIPATLDKVARLKAMLHARGLDIPVEVDGGVNLSTLEKVVVAGADMLVMGAAIFAAPEGITTVMHALRERLDSIQSGM